MHPPVVALAMDRIAAEDIVVGCSAPYPDLSPLTADVDLIRQSRRLRGARSLLLLWARRRPLRRLVIHAKLGRGLRERCEAAVVSRAECDEVLGKIVELIRKLGRGVSIRTELLAVRKLLEIGERGIRLRWERERAPFLMGKKRVAFLFRLIDGEEESCILVSFN